MLGRDTDELTKTDGRTRLKHTTGNKTLVKPTMKIQRYKNDQETQDNKENNTRTPNNKAFKIKQEVQQITRILKILLLPPSLIYVDDHTVNLFIKTTAS